MTQSPTHTFNTFLHLVVNSCRGLYILRILDSPSYEKLCTAIQNKSLMKGIKQASPFEQTSCLEGFHSVVNQFPLKLLLILSLVCSAGMYVHIIFTGDNLIFNIFSWQVQNIYVVYLFFNLGICISIDISWQPFISIIIYSGMVRRKRMIHHRWGLCTQNSKMERLLCGRLKWTKTLVWANLSCVWILISFSILTELLTLPFPTILLI